MSVAAKAASERWDINRVLAWLTAVSILVGGIGGITTIAVRQDRTERTALEAKAAADRAALEVSGINVRLAELGGQVKALDAQMKSVDGKLDRLLERGR